MYLRKRTHAKIIIFVLLLQQCAGIAALNAATADTPERASEVLLSPLKKEIAAVYQCSSLPILKTEPNKAVNQLLMPAMLSNFVLYNDQLSHLFPEPLWQQKLARIKLINELQFTNKADKRSILTQTIKPTTQAGHAAFCSFVTQEHTDWAVTQHRQEFIKALASDPGLLASIQKNLATIQQHEDFVSEQVHGKLSLWQSFAPNIWLKLFWASYLQIFTILFGSVFADKQPLHKAISLNIPLPINDQAGNKIKIPLLNQQIFSQSNQYRDFFIYWALCHLPIGAYLLKERLKNTEALGSTTHLSALTTQLLIFFGMAKQIPGSINNLRSGNNKSIDDIIADGFSLLTNVGLAGATAKSIYSTCKTHAANFITAKKIAQSVTAIENLKQLLDTNNNQALKNAYGPQLEKVLTKNWKNLVSMSKKSTFDANVEYGYTGLLRINQARVDNLNESFTKSIGDYSAMMRFYGELDVYATLAQLYRDKSSAVNNVGNPVRCCFATFIDNKEEAILITKNIWHPLIPQDRVRCNTISLGGDVDNPRHAIITGPNAAGKSVSMKALLVNIVLGQTFGFACAESFAFTPYTKVIARFTSADDTGNDQSKFMLEATDVVALLKTLEDLKPGEKAFVVTDELFSGTEVKPAILLSAELCSEVAKMKNVNYLLATHYKDLTKLKELTHNAFENYKVTAFVDENSNVSYPFTLQHGVGDVNVAFDIFLDQMRKQGIANKRLEAIIKNARGHTTITSADA